MATRPWRPCAGLSWRTSTASSRRSASAAHQRGLATGLLEVLSGRETDEGYRADRWLKACAIHVVPTVLGVSGTEVVGAAVDDPDPMIVETALWALATVAAR